MFQAKLMPLGSQDDPGLLRGWVEDLETGNTLLEFHNFAKVDEGTLAFALLMPEIMDYLHLAKHNCKVADLLIDRFYEVRGQLEKSATEGNRGIA